MEAFMIGVVAFVKMYPGTVKAGLLLLGALRGAGLRRLAAHGALACRGGGPRAGRRGDRRARLPAVMAVGHPATARAVGVGPGGFGEFHLVGARPRPSRDAGLRIGGDDALVLVPGVCRLLGGLPGRPRVPGLADEARRWLKTLVRGPWSVVRC